MATTILVFLFWILLGISKYVFPFSLWAFLFPPFALYYLALFRSILSIFLGTIAIILLCFIGLITNPSSDLMSLILISCCLVCFYIGLYFRPSPVNLSRIIEPILYVTLPGLFMLSDPPQFFRTPFYVNDFVSNIGLFGTYAVTGPLPSSWYLAVLISVYLGYIYLLRSREHQALRLSLFSIAFAIIIFVFTNRKVLLAFSLIPFLVTLASQLLLQISTAKSRYSTLIVSFIVLLTLLIIGATIFQGLDTDLFQFIDSTVARFNFYSELLSDASQPFTETGLQQLSTYFGFSTALFLSFLLLLPILLRIILGFFSSTLLIPFLYIVDFLFKEAPLVFSPSPASLLVFLLISYSLSPRYTVR